MTVAIGLGLITAIALAAYPTVHRRRIRGSVVRRVRAQIAPWLSPDPAAFLLPSIDSPSVMEGATPQGSGDTPDLLAPAVRRAHFTLTGHEIEQHGRAS